MSKAIIDEEIESQLIGIGGASASGKTTIAERILSGLEQISSELDYKIKGIIFNMDDYYKDQSHMPFEERKKTNYDSPEAFEWPLLKEHLIKLLNYQQIEKPCYLFAEHTRDNRKEIVRPAHLVILEGIFALVDPDINKMMKLKIFVDTRLTECLSRRVKRDVCERGRSIESVLEQWKETVEPGFYRYILPTKNYVNIIIDWDGGEDKIRTSIDMTLAFIEKNFREMLYKK